MKCNFRFLGRKLGYSQFKHRKLALNFPHIYGNLYKGIQISLLDATKWDWLILI